MLLHLVSGPPALQLQWICPHNPGWSECFQPACPVFRFCYSTPLVVPILCYVEYGLAPCNRTQIHSNIYVYKFIFQSPRNKCHATMVILAPLVASHGSSHGGKEGRGRAGESKLLLPASLVRALVPSVTKPPLNGCTSKYSYSVLDSSVWILERQTHSNRSRGERIKKYDTKKVSQDENKSGQTFKRREPQGTKIMVARIKNHLQEIRKGLAFREAY